MNSIFIGGGEIVDIFYTGVDSDTQKFNNSVKSKPINIPQNNKNISPFTKLTNIDMYNKYNGVKNKTPIKKDIQNNNNTHISDFDEDLIFQLDL